MNVKEVANQSDRYVLEVVLSIAMPKRSKGPPCAVGRGSDGTQTAFSTDDQDVINSILQSSPT